MMAALAAGERKPAEISGLRDKSPMSRLSALTTFATIPQHERVASLQVAGDQRCPGARVPLFSDKKPQPASMPVTRTPGKRVTTEL